MMYMDKNDPDLAIDWPLPKRGNSLARIVGMIF